MTIIGLLVAICILLLMLWLTKTYLPQPWQTPVLVVIVLVALVWLATLLFPSVASMRITR